jgi:hypothetical protein
MGSHYTLNLSSVPLTSEELKLLDKGLTFIPVYRHMDTHTIYGLQNRLTRNLKLKDYFKDEDKEKDSLLERFVRPKTWTPSDAKISTETLDIIQEIYSSTEETMGEHVVTQNKTITLPRIPDNLSRGERTALVNLRKRQDIIIKPADKGSATVVMDKSAYIQEAHRQLNNANYYKKLQSSMIKNNCQFINDILSDMQLKKQISEEQFLYLKANETDRPRRFYMLPKIHKARSKWPQPDRMPEGRPIVSDSGSESGRVAEFIDSFIKPISVRHRSYLKDTYHFVRKISHHLVPREAILVTGDVTALYTNMKHDRIMSTVRAALVANPTANRPDENLLRLLDYTLRSNDFTFNDETYLQICGTAMGKDYAPSLADLYLIEFDDGAHNYISKPKLYSRFLDDIFFIWMGSEEQLESFGRYLNSLIEGITVTLTYSRESVSFLDTVVYKSDTVNNQSKEVELLTKVYFKPTDTHQLLHKDSFHPKHTCKGVLKSQFLRFKRLSSSKKEYDGSCKVLMDALAGRNYSQRLMRHMKKTIWQSPMMTGNVDQRPILPIIVPYNPVGTRLGYKWRQSINNSEFFKSSYKFITAYTTGRNLRKILIRSLLTTNAPRRPSSGGRILIQCGCRPCSSPRCRAGTYVCDTRIFTSSTNGKAFRIKESITCETSNVIYLITCKQCNKQYVGETSRRLGDRLVDHLSAIRLRRPTPIGLHFNLPHHNMAHVLITGIERFGLREDVQARKTKEVTWQNLLQTAYPLGINNLRASHIRGPYRALMK